MQPEFTIVLELNVEPVNGAEILTISFQADSRPLLLSITAVVIDLELGELIGLEGAEFAFHV